MATTELVKTIITVEQVASNFKIVNDELDKYEAISKAVVVNDDESLAIAENNMASVKELIKRTNAAHSVLKKPYYETGKMIDQYKKSILDRLDAFANRIALPITNWKSVQVAARKIDLEKQRKEIEAEDLKKSEEVDKLSRLTRMIYAKLYGGTFYTKDGEEKMASGCQAPEHCAALSELINEKFPDEEQFPYFPKKRNEMVIKALKDIRKHQIDLMETVNLNEGIAKAAKARIRAARKEAGMEAEKIQESLDKKINRDKKKILREGEKEVKEAASGTRNILKFKVVNDLQVTREYLSVDESKIRAWMEGQTADIKGQLQEGLQPIAGVEFYVETTYVSK